MRARYRVALRGFSGFERSALGSYFRLSAERRPVYEQVPTLEMADFVVADADRPEVVDELARRDRLRQAVFVGAHPPPGTAAWTMRPIDPLHVLRELDALAALHDAQPLAAATAWSPRPQRAVAGANGVDPAAVGDEPGRPQRRAWDSAPVPLDEAPADPTAHAPPRLPEALLVDPDDTAPHPLEQHLQALGLATQCVGDSAQALARLADAPVDFVFIAAELGAHSELDGLALCRQIKRRQRPLAGALPVVVLLSERPGASDRVRGTLAGCDAYLAKPPAATELRELLHRHGVRIATADARAPRR